jgi:phage shock protein C
MTTTSKLTRSESERMIAGVCGGLGAYFGLDPTVVRLLFLLGTIFFGGGIVLYVALWIVVPRESSADLPSEAVVRENVAEGRQAVERAARSLGDEINRAFGRSDHPATPPDEAAPTSESEAASTTSGG